MKRSIPRVVTAHASTELAAMAIMLYSIPRPKESLACEAFLVYPGMGETWRLEHAIRAWQDHNLLDYTKYLLIAGTEWRKEKTAVRPPIVKNLRKHPYYLTKTRGVHAQNHARHTKDQAEWVVKKVQELKIQSLALYVSPYHLLRAYLTLIKTFINQKVRWIPVIPVPVKISPAEIIPETKTDAWGMVQAEMNRIKIYQKQGDVATLAELKSYLKWCWWQEPLYFDLF